MKKLINVQLNLQQKEVSPSSQEQIVTADNGYLGLSQVKVGAQSGVSIDFVNGLISKTATNLNIPNSVTSIGDYAFSYCSSCLLFDFRNATQVPALLSTNAFTLTNANKKIVVPDSLYDTWITSTNWSSTTNNIVSSIVKASEYTD